MGDQKNNVSGRGAGILGTVQIVFLILYLTDTGKVGEWPLVYVLMPLIVEGGIIVLACCCAGAAFALAKPATTAECPI